jgi:NitT/TauT family transport system ATP-binding protein
MSRAPFKIELRDVTHRFRRGGPIILDTLRFDVRPAERVAIIGRSGSGKSTLLQIIAGLTRPAGGSVVVDGSEVTAPSPRCTLMFQRPLLFPWLTLAQNVALALRFANRPKEASARVRHLLRLVGLAGYEAARVNELSGGQ